MATKEFLGHKKMRAGKKKKKTLAWQCKTVDAVSNRKDDRLEPAV